MSICIEDQVAASSTVGGSSHSDREVRAQRQGILSYTHSERCNGVVFRDTLHIVANLGKCRVQNGGAHNLIINIVPPTRSKPDQAASFIGSESRKTLQSIPELSNLIRLQMLCKYILNACQQLMKEKKNVSGSISFPQDTSQSIS